MKSMFENPIVSEVSLSYRSKIPAKVRPTIKSSQDAYKVLITIYNQKTIEHSETVYLLLLNRANKVLGVAELSCWGTTGCLIDVKVILQYCLKASASNFILSHNHPSGNIEPSEADIRVSRKAKSAGELLDITMLDHIIITKDSGFYSLADNGKI